MAYISGTCNEIGQVCAILVVWMIQGGLNAIFRNVFSEKVSLEVKTGANTTNSSRGGRGRLEGGLIRTWHRYGNPIATPSSARSFGNRILQNFQIGNAISNRGLERKCERDPFLLLSWSRSGEEA